MSWFRRSIENISSDNQKKEMPEGMWNKCSSCGEIIHKGALDQNLWVCTKCSHHFRIGSNEYFGILFDAGTFKEFDSKMSSKDPLNFVDTKKYRDRIKETIKKTGLSDALRYGTGKMNNREVVIACLLNHSLKCVHIALSLLKSTELVSFQSRLQQNESF